MFSLIAKSQEVGPWRNPRGSAAVILGQYGRSTRAEDHCKYEGLADNSHFTRSFRKTGGGDGNRTHGSGGRSGSPKFKVPRRVAFFDPWVVTQSRQWLPALAIALSAPSARVDLSSTRCVFSRRLSSSFSRSSSAASIRAYSMSAAF